MKKISLTYRLSALFLTFLMLFSSIGFSMDVHFCNEGLGSVSFFGKADECADVIEDEELTHDCCGSHEVEKSHCEKTSTDCEIGDEDCCHNESFTFQTMHDASHSNSLEIANIDLTFVTIFIFNHFHLFEGESTVEDFFYYSSPPIVNDVTVLHQVFLI